MPKHKEHKIKSKVTDKNIKKNVYKQKVENTQSECNEKKRIIIPTPQSTYPKIISDKIKKSRKINFLSETLENKLLSIGIISFLFLFSLILISECFFPINSNTIITGQSFKMNISNTFSNLYEADKVEGVSTKLNQDIEGWQSLFEIRPLSLLFQGIFGKLITSPELNEISSFIVTIALWFLFFLTVSDIINTFSSFSKQMAYGISFLITVIIANFGIIFKFLFYLVFLFSLLFETSVLIGLLGAFITFIGVNWGIKSLGDAIIQKKAKDEIKKAKLGGESLKESIKAIDEAGKALRNIGDNVKGESKNK